MINPCRFCPAECCKTYVITATAFDILRITQATGKPAAGFATLHEPRLLAFDPDTILDTADGYGRYVLGLHSHPCIFLDKNRCSIHQNAPLSCRRYPYQITGRINARFCTLLSGILFRIKGPDIGPDQLVSELDEHKRLVALWNKRQGKRKDCIDFLLKHAASGACEL